jgi:cytoskeleton protein RodZ
VFEIGNSLREARLRQGFELLQVEADTKIRGKYLRALEEEHFSVLPGETYVKGFLRTYAEYLGLDGQLYVDEFNSRFASAPEPLVTAPARPRRRSASESSFVVVVLAGIVAVGILVVVAFTLGSEGTEDPGANVAGTPPAAPPPAAAPPAPPPAPASRKPTVAKLVLTAARGDCWVAVRAGAPDGELLFSGTMYRGESKRFSAKRLWLEFGDAPAENLNVKLNGRQVRRFPTDAPVVLVTSRGVRAQA